MSESRIFSSDTRGASAVEFAFVAPVFLMIVFGIAAFGYVFGVYQGIQQIASEAARAAVAGISDAERDTIARGFVSTNAGTYALIDTRKVVVTTTATGAPAPAFLVSVSYDLTGTFPYQFANLLPLPSPRIQRTAVIQRGGY
jgi:Flp pilus assembly protein TadG